jgi:tRNA threonylcarbamoyladenosine modification (KEOPS) complex  Pcc1 subunit
LKNYKGKIQISFKKLANSECKLIAKSVSCALRSDTKFSTDPKARARISADSSNVFIEVHADDIPSLRACINSYLRLAYASYKCVINQL